MNTPVSSRVALPLFVLAATLAGAALLAQEGPKQKGDDSLEMQAARAKSLLTRGHEVTYSPKWDLSGLPHYSPKEQVSGTIRMWGNNYIGDGDLGRYWEEGFRKFQPQVRFEYHLNGATGVPALYTGVADIGPSRRITFAELLAFQRTLNYNPVELAAATGSLDVPGWNPAFIILVSKANPIQGLTMNQLDGIFGAERTGGWVGTSWHTEFARGPEGNIRTWGQAGATGAWADKPVHPYGLNLRYHQATTFADVVLKGGDKWNEKTRFYANYVKPDGTLGRSMMADLVQDPYGIAYVAGKSKEPAPEVKVMPIATGNGGPFITPTIESVHDHTYPLADEMYFYLNRAPGKPLDPKVREYVTFVLSQEGQAAVMRDAKYLPLTAEIARESLRKLD